VSISRSRQRPRTIIAQPPPTESVDPSDRARPRRPISRQRRCPIFRRQSRSLSLRRNLRLSL
jgi:hypothetical protein